MCRATSLPKAGSERSRTYCCSHVPSSVIVSLFIRTRRKQNPTEIFGSRAAWGPSRGWTASRPGCLNAASAATGMAVHRFMISLQHLTKRFGSQVAVNSLSFDVPAGQIVGFLGPNGAGKSTTLKMLTGMIEPTDGTATVCGFDLRRDTLEVKRHVGFVPESGAVFESLTGLEYLEMVGALYGIPPDAALARIRQFIAFFDLSFETLTDKLLGAYSKGMRRKVVITSALLHNPPVVFFDEPLDGLDANAAVGFKALIQTLAREGKTIVYSSHILDVVERVCDRVIIIDKGRLLIDGQPEELVAAHQSGTLERLFTQLTGGTELERRAEDFAKTFRS